MCHNLIIFWHGSGCGSIFSGELGANQSDRQNPFTAEIFSPPRLKDLKYIAIDEFAVRKGHRYYTVVMDLTTGSVVYVGEGRSASTLVPFLKRLKASRAQIPAVATDMWPAYIDAVTMKLPQAKIVFDRFHITQILHRHLQDIRRELFHQEKGALKKNILKGTRWL